ncbi:hypothetical protein TrLO_g8872 [Triparma laevis f. longispina]|uniref:Uncharacterized protein n=1 Tax=Triparma laevis f. longispina TaxID=1714387 RepID=A0A9W7F6W3_9STRA|nr:hypothetical protein TrLO_g8872 [Triparma laevis f. longispina]
MEVVEIVNMLSSYHIPPLSSPPATPSPFTLNTPSTVKSVCCSSKAVRKRKWMTSQPAFLHFMDHSDFPVMEGTHPKDYGMEGEKVRVWVKEVDEEKGRVKVTGNRPDDLPRLGWE